MPKSRPTGSQHEIPKSPRPPDQERNHRSYSQLPHPGGTDLPLDRGTGHRDWSQPGDTPDRPGVIPTQVIPGSPRASLHHRARRHGGTVLLGRRVHDDLPRVRNRALRRPITPGPRQKDGPAGPERPKQKIKGQWGSLHIQRLSPPPTRPSERRTHHVLLDIRAHGVRGRRSRRTIRDVPAGKPVPGKYEGQPKPRDLKTAQHHPQGCPGARPTGRQPLPGLQPVLLETKRPGKPGGSRPPNTHKARRQSRPKEKTD